MKLKFKKIKKGVYQSAIYRGKGGLSSLIYGAEGDLIHCLKTFSIRNFWRALTWK